MIRAGALVGLALAATACAPENPTSDYLTGRAWDTARGTQAPDGESLYFLALQQDYLAAATAERAEYDWRDTRVFLNKAEAAGQRREVAPFSQETRPVHGPEAEALAAARAELAAFISMPGVRRRVGRQLGEAQVAYDRWHQEAEEGHQDTQIDDARMAFEGVFELVRALGPLGGNIATVLPEDGEIGGVSIGTENRVELNQPFQTAAVDGSGREIAVHPDEIGDRFKGAIGAAPPPSQFFCVLFPTGSARVLPDRFSPIWLAALAARNQPGAEILVTGQADSLGTEAANLRLSKRRAETVRTILLDQLEGAEDIVNRPRHIGEATFRPVLTEKDSAGCGEGARRVVLEVR